jgi:GT2 family glycosyltransferase
LEKDFSLVIPTLYGTELEETLIQIHKGTYIPTEIIIVIPLEFQKNIDGLKKYSNLIILGVDFRGQVRQRIFGFKHASYDIVIQLDDDIFVDPNCFENLIETIYNSDERIAVAPLFKFNDTQNSCYNNDSKWYLLHRIIHGKNFLKSGKITASGFPMGIFHNELDKRLFESDWVPGGCLAHKKCNLILENYYPFNGKAYFEDVYHSVLLRNKSVKLLVDNKAICLIEPYEKTNFKSNLDEFLYFKKYRKHLIRLLNGNFFHLNLECFLQIILYVKNVFFPKKSKSEISFN